MTDRSRPVFQERRAGGKQNPEADGPDGSEPHRREREARPRWHVAARVRTRLAVSRSVARRSRTSNAPFPPPRDGRAEALAQDAIDLADALGIERFAVVGHDWGARAAYALAAVIPERLSAIAALSIGYPPRGAFVVPDFSQARAWWYQWLMSVDRGAEAVARDPKAFAPVPVGHLEPPGVVCRGRVRDHRPQLREPRLAGDHPPRVPEPLARRAGRCAPRPTPGAGDGHREHRRADADAAGRAGRHGLPASTEGKERFFTAGYRRLVLPGVGHFPAREAPGEVARALLAHLAR